MKSLAARALAAGTVAAGALMISVPAAGAATHGKGGSGQQGNGQGAAQAGKSHGNHGNGNGNENKGEAQSGKGSSKAPASTKGHKGHHGGGKGSGTTSGSGSGKAPVAAGHAKPTHGHGHKGTGGNSGSGGQAPAGNNGTIKLDQSPLTSGSGANHANHPHLSCQLALSFFGFDAGTDSATVQFSAQPPSGKFTPVPVTSGPTDFSFTVDQRTGGGQLDTSKAYTLDVSGLKAAKQGYHIRVVTHVTYSQGSDVKQKVFWYQPCTQAPTSQSSSSGSTSSGQTTETSHSQSSSQTTARGHQVTKRQSSSGFGGYGLGAGPHGVTAHKKATRLESSRSGSFGYGGYGLGAGPGGTELASSNSGQLPSGAGTDLGWFSPGNGSLAPELELMGGLGLLGGGSLVIRRMRKRRA